MKKYVLSLLICFAVSPLTAFSTSTQEKKLSNDVHVQKIQISEHDMDIIEAYNQMLMDLKGSDDKEMSTSHLLRHF